MPSKFDSIKVLQPTKARDDWICESCGKVIVSGETYYRESLGLIRKPIGMKLRAFCQNCFKEKGERLLQLKPSNQGLDDQVSKD